MLEAARSRQPRLARFVCHMYQRLQQKRVNLVTGAGISIEAKIPGWNDLLARLSAADAELAKDVQSHLEARLHPEYLGQIVYHRHRAQTPIDTPEELWGVT